MGVTYKIQPLYLGEITKYEKSMHTYGTDYGVKMVLAGVSARDEEMVAHLLA